MLIKVISMLAIFGLFSSTPKIGRFATDPEDKKSLDQYNYQPKKEPVLVYTTQDKNKYNIKRNKGYEHEDLVSFDQKPKGFSMSPDKNHLAVYFDRLVKMLDMRTKETRDIITPKNEVCGLDYSPDSKNLMVWDQKCRSSYVKDDYLVHQYNLDSGKDNIIFEGQSKNYFSPYAWRPDNKIILIEIKGSARIVWVFDIQAKIMNQTDYKNPLWISHDGRYMAMPEGRKLFRGHDDLYNPYNMRENMASRSYRGNYKMVNPLSGQDYGSFGMIDGYNSIVGYSPDRNQLMYRSSKSIGKDNWQYRTASLNDPYSERIATNPYELLEQWNTGNIGAEIDQYGGDNIIRLSDLQLASEQNRLGLISQYYSDQDYRPDHSRSYYHENYTKHRHRTTTRKISLRNDKFGPKVVSARVGDRLIWTNRDDVEHTVTSTEYGFDSGVIYPGQTFEIDITRQGQFYYSCRIHPEMEGRIKIK